MAKLTEAQRWALRAIRDGYGGTPAAFGERMMERPGAMGDRTVHYKAQGYGRMGGSMMGRLKRMGFVTVSYQTRMLSHPGQATITPAGRAALEASS